VGQNELARDVLKHIMTLYRHSPLSEESPLEYPDSPERYQLFFIDDDESDHAPDYDMGPRNADEPIGEFATLAFIANRSYKQASSAITEQIQSQAEKNELEAQDKRLLFITCNTAMVNKMTHTVVMDNS
jgi:hypothetical protein